MYKAQLSANVSPAASVKVVRITLAAFERARDRSAGADAERVAGAVIDIQGSRAQQARTASQRGCAPGVLDVEFSNVDCELQGVNMFQKLSNKC
jgi:hypothetical protein